MTKAELLEIAKPILLNTEMTRAIKDNRKTVTRRVVNPQPTYSSNYGFSWKGAAYGTDLPPTEKGAASNFRCAAPYRPGDILYVPERWKSSPDSQLWDDGEYRVVFPDGEVVWFYFENPKRAEKWQKYIDKPLNNWQSPYFMPREAARLFLRVTDVRVERLQDITEEQAKAEGAVKAYPYTDPITRETVFAESKYGTYLAGFECLWNKCYAAPRGVKGRGGVITHYESYPFEEIRETRTYKGKPWYVIGNPWVWGYEFERMEAEK